MSQSAAAFATISVEIRTICLTQGSRQRCLATLPRSVHKYDRRIFERDPNSLGCASRIEEVRGIFPFQSIFPPALYQILGLPMRPGRSLHASNSDYDFVQSGTYNRPFRKLMGTGQLSRRASGGVLECGFKSYERKQRRPVRIGQLLRHRI